MCGVLPLTNHRITSYFFSLNAHQHHSSIIDRQRLQHMVTRGTYPSRSCSATKSRKGKYKSHTVAFFLQSRRCNVLTSLCRQIDQQVTATIKPLNDKTLPSSPFGKRIFCTYSLDFGIRGQQFIFNLLSIRARRIRGPLKL